MRCPHLEVGRGRIQGSFVPPQGSPGVTVERCLPICVSDVGVATLHKPVPLRGLQESLVHRSEQQGVHRDFPSGLVKQMRQVEFGEVHVFGLVRHVDESPETNQEQSDGTGTKDERQGLTPTTSTVGVMFAIGLGDVPQGPLQDRQSFHRR